MYETKKTKKQVGVASIWIVNWNLLILGEVNMLVRQKMPRAVLVVKYTESYPTSHPAFLLQLVSTRGGKLT